MSAVPASSNGTRAMALPSPEKSAGSMVSVSEDMEAGRMKHYQPAVATPPLPSPSGVRGNPGPFGLLCQGITTCLIFFIVTKWTNPGFLPTVLSYSMAMGGIGQLIAGILELIRGATFAGTTFASYGCFWLGRFLWLLLEVNRSVPAVADVALTGDTLWCCLWGFLTFCYFIIALRKNMGLVVIFATLWIAFFLLAGGNYNPRCRVAAGYMGFINGLACIYGALGLLFQEEMGWTFPGMRPVKLI
ncbi:GPR1/FUN34/yaaH family-domain-containing protein [Haematococcus lacustris]